MYKPSEISKTNGFIGNDASFQRIRADRGKFIVSGFLQFFVVAVFTILVCLSPDPVLAQKAPEDEPDINQLIQGKAYVYKLDPEGSAGKGYKLVYMVAAPLGAYWKFKTDFENDFLLTNKLIKEHRLVEHKNNVVITESI